MRGEKIDIVPFSEDLPDFVAKALSPAKVSQVIISDDGTQADVIVPDHQLCLAIGKEGQNARLAARLTGVRVDIRGETQVAEGEPAGGYPDDVEYAEGEWVDNAETGKMEWHAADGSVMSQAEWVEHWQRRRRAPRDADGQRHCRGRQQANSTAEASTETSETERSQRDDRGRWRIAVIPTARSERASDAARGVRRSSSPGACSVQMAWRAVDRHGDGTGRVAVRRRLPRARRSPAGVRPCVAHKRWGAGTTRTTPAGESRMEVPDSVRDLICC